VSVGYFVVRWQIPDLYKWLLIVIVSFAVIVGLFEWVVRRSNLMRFLFGMKMLAEAVPLTVPGAATAGIKIS
jgi:hypothetical protein